uniref:Thiolase N-terminal domain-containing protein n=1 Tax=Paramoeba aestuarina TaxID=180227 RepID=A0A7S4L890_9EUKA
MQALRRVAIVSATRTPIGTFGGSLMKLKNHDLAAVAIKDAVAQVPNLDASSLGDVRIGCCMEDIESLNVARVASLLAGIPETVPAVTTNRVCTSSMEALITATLQIQAGWINSAVVGGVESMSNAPYVLPDARWGARFQDSTMKDSIVHALHAGSKVIKYPSDGPVEWARGKPYIMGLTAEFLAEKYGFTREQQDEVALRSQNNAERASTTGIFDSEITPVVIKGKKGKETIVSKDEHFKPGLTMDQLASLPPAFIPKTGTVTAGNSSGINDGACAMVIMAEEEAERQGIEPLAYVTGAGMGACSPDMMGCSPVPAVHNLMERTGRKSVNEWERVEVNEAFAAQYLAVEKELELNREVWWLVLGLNEVFWRWWCRLLLLFP